MTDNNLRDNREKFRKISIFGLMMGLLVILFVTPLGFIPLGLINITTMHIPVVLSSILLGPAYGGFMGFLFGLFSFMKNTFSPGATSFLFSPFVDFGAVSGSGWSLVIAFVPRILIGILPALIYRALNRVNEDREALNAGIGAGISTMIHTALVFVGILTFFADEFAEALNIAVNTVLSVLGATVLFNGFFEALLAAFLTYAIMKVYLNYRKR